MATLPLHGDHPDHPDGAFRRCRWVNPEKQCYTIADVERDLLGDIVLSCHWGGIGNGLGGTKRVCYPDWASAWKALDAVRRQRERHGYQPVAL